MKSLDHVSFLAPRVLGVSVRPFTSTSPSLKVNEVSSSQKNPRRNMLRAHIDSIAEVSFSEKIQQVFQTWKNNGRRAQDGIAALENLAAMYKLYPSPELRTFAKMTELMKKVQTDVESFTLSDVSRCIRALVDLEYTGSSAAGLARKLEDQIIHHMHLMDGEELAELTHLLAVKMGCSLDLYYSFAVEKRLAKLFQATERGGTTLLARKVAIMHYFAHPSMKLSSKNKLALALKPEVMANVAGLGGADLIRLLQTYKAVPSQGEVISSILEHLTPLVDTFSQPELVGICDTIGSSSTNVTELVSVLEARLLLCGRQMLPEALAVCVVGLGDLASDEFLTRIAGTLTGMVDSLTPPSSAKLYWLFSQKPTLSDAEQALLNALELSLQTGMMALAEDSKHNELFGRLCLALAQAGSYPETYDAVERAAIKSAEKTLLPATLCDVALCLAYAGRTHLSLWEHFAVDARLKHFDTKLLPVLAWCMAVTDADLPLAWNFLVEKILSAFVNPSEQQAVTLYEALTVAKLSRLYVPPATLEKPLTDFLAACYPYWQRKQQTYVRSEVPYQQIMEAMHVDFELDAMDSAKLYLMPVHAKGGYNVIVDALSALPIHQGSKKLVCEVAMRHNMWRLQGYDVLAVMDSTMATFRTPLAVEGEGGLTEGDVAEWRVKDAASFLMKEMRKVVAERQAKTESAAASPPPPPSPSPAAAKAKADVRAKGSQNQRQPMVRQPREGALVRQRPSLEQVIKNADPQRQPRSRSPLVKREKGKAPVRAEEEGSKIPLPKWLPHSNARVNGTEAKKQYRRPTRQEGGQERSNVGVNAQARSSVSQPRLRTKLGR